MSHATNTWCTSMCVVCVLCVVCCALCTDPQEDGITLLIIHTYFFFSCSLPYQLPYQLPPIRTLSVFYSYADAFGEKECLTALTPDGTIFGLLEPLSMWIFGDVWVRSFYTVFEKVREHSWRLWRLWRLSPNKHPFTNTFFLILKYHSFH